MAISPQEWRLLRCGRTTPLRETWSLKCARGNEIDRLRMDVIFVNDIPDGRTNLRLSVKFLCLSSDNADSLPRVLQLYKANCF